MRTYRQITWVFLGTSLAALLLLAVVNVATSKAVRDGTRSWWDPGVAFNADKFATLASWVLFPAGISIDPDNAVVGRSGWAFLGDAYRSSISAVREPATRAQRREAATIGDGVIAWRDWLAARGAPRFWVLVAPDKDDVYPDYLPGWVRPAAGNAQDVVRAAMDPQVLIDGGAVLRAERSKQTQLLFKVTDTHWSNLGAWLATKSFFERAASSDASLRLPRDVVVGPSEPSPGGDLARFLYLGDILADEAQQVSLAGIQAPETQRTEYDAPGAVPVAGQQPPFLFRTAGALNERRVLWLRDSFGAAMAPYMHAAFSDVLEFHSINQPKAIAALVEQFEPELVLVTVVDRGAGLPIFLAGPPS